MSDNAHLTSEEVEALLRFVEDYDPIIVGGQSINIWAELFHGESQALDAMSPLTSKDVDFLHNLEAERALTAALRDGQLNIPTVDDNTPEAAVVTGYLGDKKVTIDFLGSVLGVETETVRKRSITFSDPERKSASITLMHPLDGVRSRLIPAVIKYDRWYQLFLSSSAAWLLASARAGACPLPTAMSQTQSPLV